MTNIPLSASFVSGDGGIIQYVAHDGELLMEVRIPAGIVPARQYISMCPDGASLQTADGLAVYVPKSGLGVVHGRATFESGANPDFQTTSASTLERNVRLTLARLQTAEKRILARERALLTIPRIPDAKPDQAEKAEKAEKANDMAAVVVE